MKKIHTVLTFGELEIVAFSSFAKANAHCLAQKSQTNFVKWYTTFQDKQLVREYVDVNGNAVMILRELRVV